MKYPIAELCDRYSIERLKVERIPDYRSQFVVDVQKYFGQTFGDITLNAIFSFIDELKEWNGRIWDLESDIRKGKEGELGLEEVGKRALAIRDLNNKRIEVKNKVASYFDEYEEKKFNHASE